MRLLVIGGSGLLGFKIAWLAVKQAFETFATYNLRPVKLEGCNFYRLDISNKGNTFTLIKKLMPDVIIDTAALHNVDYCETHPDETWKVNVEGTKNIVYACKEVSAKMIFISTDYVFDGKKGFYTEEDSPNPLHYYAKTKLVAENMVKGAGIDYVIVRPSVIYGWNPVEATNVQSSSKKSVNFVMWAINKLKKGEEIKAVTDQYNSPTLADNLAEVLLVLSKSNRRGLYHIAGKTCLNRFEFTQKIAEVFGFDRNLIKPTTSDVFRQVAKRPKRCCLDVTKAERELRVKLLTIDEGLKKMKVQMDENVLQLTK
jgi:dTDP-4-dehydrorhamnose reductase